MKQENELIYPIINGPNASMKIFPNKKFEIFNLKNKKIGRHKKFSQEFRLKTKNNPDNIFRKIKVHFFNFILKFLNLSIKSYFGFQKYKFLKLNQNVIKDSSIRFNKKIFSSNLFELNLFNISNKYANKNMFSNKILMDKLIEIDSSFLTIFEIKLTILYSYYIDENCKNIIKNLIGLNEGIISFNEFIENEIQKNEFNSNNIFVDNNEYIENVKNIGYNFFNFMNNIKERKIRKQKTIEKFID
jgi:hypothetical protein